MTIHLVIQGSGSEQSIDSYELCDSCISLSPTLEQFVNFYEQNDNDEEPIEDQSKEIILPVSFEQKYMQIVCGYLNFFASNDLPMKITFINKSTQIHSKIMELLDKLTVTEISKLRTICTYFELTAFMNQIDALLAIKLLTNPKEILKTFHEPNLTLAAQDVVTNELAIF